MFSFIKPASIVLAEENNIGINAEAAMIVEASTGKILYEQNPDESLGIASMTKMMTEYLLLEAINDGSVNWEDTYTPNNYVYEISQNTNFSNVPLRKDGSYKVKDLYEAMAIYSANGAAIAISEMVAGTETAFVKKMNEKAKELGLENTTFVNVTGLPNSDLNGQHPEGTDANGENMMSARSVSKLAYHLLKDYPEILNTAKIERKEFVEGTQMENWNWMLPGLVLGKEGVDGLKTGSSDFAGECFTGTAERNGMRVITVVMDAKGNGKNYTNRFSETEKLMDYAFQNFTSEELFSANYQIKDQSTFTVSKGKEKEVEVETKNPLSMIIRNGEKENYDPVYKLNEELFNENEQLTAPIEKGEKVGTMTYKYVGEKTDYGFIDSQSDGQVDLVTTTSVEKANWFVLSMRSIGGLFSDVWSSITKTVSGWF
ncbi:D-alanyl-D-alanine carboxypeptidase family protein [Bacillus carboniphilus]|uniref:serine-type D-Ala-D-Ala carboxypeptidase n=1 Tax=Bacillus carboniphilus TaxID=86663 RepID=A0ABY9JZY8_9BACI|nr:D-alanyl-D-alanine carboxypeptidase family protein [Bacillus carboniphilus]WLR44348.1 D-alanyl-D-alanine carboxypeptidase family protein [Bacillus carboniphilus]